MEKNVYIFQYVHWIFLGSAPSGDRVQQGYQEGFL